MRFFTLATAALSWTASSASPLVKRALSNNDQMVLKLATYLEHLEYALYSGGYNNFTDAQYTAAGFPSGFRSNVGLIAQQEQTHANTLTAILGLSGISAPPPCTYSFPYTDPKSFVALANMITNVGIGAYLGGGQLLVDDPNLLVDASTILTVEARHDTFLRDGIGASPFPTAFDTPLTALWAYSLAQAFIVSCPMQLPITPLPVLNITSPMPPSNLQPATPAGTTLSLKWDPTKFFVSVPTGTQLYVAFINQDTPPPFVKVTSTGTGTGTVVLPSGVAGIAFGVLTTFSGGLNASQLSSYGTLAGPVELALS